MLHAVSESHPTHRSDVRFSEKLLGASADCEEASDAQAYYAEREGVGGD